MRDRAKRSSCFAISELRKDWKKDAISLVAGTSRSRVVASMRVGGRIQIGNLRESAGGVAGTLDGSPIRKGKWFEQSSGEHGRKAERSKLLSRW